MANFISEDQIELALLQRPQHLGGYDALNCFTASADALNDGSGRGDKGRLAAALLGPGDASFDGYPDESLAERHRRNGQS